MLKDYFNQRAQWKRIIETDAYNQPIYEVREIQCRKVGKRKLVRNKQGTEGLSTMTVYCADKVCVDDLIDGTAVIAVKDYVVLDGKAIGYEVSL